MPPNPGEMDRLIRNAAQTAFDAVNAKPGEETAPLSGAEVPPLPAATEAVPTASQPGELPTPVAGDLAASVDMSPYFGIDPTGIPAEKWSQILDHLKRQDSTIGRLNQRLASRRRLEGEENVPIREAARSAYQEVTTSPTSRTDLASAVQPVQQAPLDPSQVSDLDFVAALGIDPEAIGEDLVKVIGTLARETLATKLLVAQVTSKSDEDEAVRFWNDSLDRLEQDFDPFPKEWDRTAILQYAIDEDITSPYELYFRLMAQAKTEVEAATRDARHAALVERLKQEQAGGLRPASSAAGDTPDVTEKKDLRKAVAQAIAAAEKKHGTTIADAVKARLIEQ